MVTKPACSKVRIGAPVAASHNFNVPSRLSDRIRVPSGENATEVTGYSSPSKVRNNAPVAASQSFASPAPESTRAPSGENATEPMEFLSPKVRSSAPVAASHSFMVPSSLPESTRVPSVERANDLIAPECGIWGTISIFGFTSVSDNSGVLGATVAASGAAPCDGSTVCLASDR